MNKEKTGELIREARIKKNYTQSELGDLLGVTNKAVSRWEKGESFPDVGVLENLSSVLDIKIQDIVTGNSETDEADNEAITDIVRFVRMQQGERNRKISGYLFIILSVLCCFVSGVAGLTSSGMFYSDVFGITYMILMAITFGLIMYRYLHSKEVHQEAVKTGKCIEYISIISFIWCLAGTWIYMIMINDGHIPFGMELSSVGPFINNQLIIIFIINLVIVIIEMYQNINKQSGMHWNSLVSVAAIYLAALYGDMLHRALSVQDIYKLLLIRSIIAIAELIIVGIIYVRAYRQNKMRIQHKKS